MMQAHVKWKSFWTVEQDCHMVTTDCSVQMSPGGNRSGWLLFSYLFSPCRIAKGKRTSTGVANTERVTEK
jgi:hypothetical protein